MVTVTSLVEVAGIKVACKDHVARTVGDAIVFVRSNIVKKLVDSVNSGLGGRGLLGANGAKNDNNCFVNRASVPQEGADDTLDVFDAICIKLRA